MRELKATGWTLNSVSVTGENTIDWVEVSEPTAGPDDVLLKMKADGICGLDAMCTMYRGFPARQGTTSLGPKPATVVAEIRWGFRESKSRRNQPSRDFAYIPMGNTPVSRPTYG